MPSILDEPPVAVRRDLDSLEAALDAEVPPKHVDRNLLIATWNIKAFASLTRKWTAGSGDSPKRDLRGLRAIISIISRFDVIAVQEIKGDLRALRDTMRYLGDDWAFLMTDVTRGPAGNSERLGFIYDRRRVRPSGLACELVVPEERLQQIAPDALRRQFARTPYAVSFRCSFATFILVTLHVDYGNSASGRIPELTEIAHWMATWAVQANRWHHDLIALGDFNIDRRNDALWKAFSSQGLIVPEALEQVPRSIFDDPQDPLDKYYDQIAWFQEDTRELLSMNFRSAGGFDFVPHCYRDQHMSRTSMQYRVSDHYPLWAEFTP